MQVTLHGVKVKELKQGGIEDTEKETGQTHIRQSYIEHSWSKKIDRNGIWTKHNTNYNTGSD